MRDDLCTYESDDDDDDSTVAAAAAAAAAVDAAEPAAELLATGRKTPGDTSTACIVNTPAGTSSPSCLRW